MLAEKLHTVLNLVKLWVDECVLIMF